MSVAVLSRDEFINIFAASWCYGSAGSSEAMRRFDRMAEEANALMLANLATYNHAYSETGGEEDLISAGEIKSALVRMTAETQSTAYKSFESIRYNLVSNDGTDFATSELLDVLLSLARGFLRRAMLTRQVVH